MKAPTILLVDDNADSLKTYSKALKRRVRGTSWIAGLSETDGASLKIEWAVNVGDALEKLRSDVIDLVIVDLRLPGLEGNAMGGTAVIRESINLDPLRPVIVITGFGTLELARSSFAQGIFDFIEKSENADVELAASVQRAIDIHAEKIIRSGNPFTPMAGIQPRVFGGRTSELEFFEQRINRALTTGICEHFMVLGDWGIGKSTLFQEYKRLCRSRGNLACIVPLEPVQTGMRLSEVARSIVEGILRDCPYPMERFKHLTEFFQSFGVNIFGTGLQFSRDVSKRDFLPQAFLHDTLVRLWEDLKEKTGVLTILLDDLDNLQSMPEIVMTLRQTLSMDGIQRCRILVGLTCTRRTWRKLIASDSHHPLARYFLSRIELSHLSHAETRDTILKCLSGSGVSFTQEIIEKVCEITMGHPFEMQVLCKCLFDNQLSAHVGVEMWEKSVDTALRHIGPSVFDNWLEGITKDDREMLNHLAKVDEPLTIESICEWARRQGVNKMASESEVLRAVKSFCELGILVRGKDLRYLLSDRLFGSYLCSAVP
jgi:CheY-like chemotaxis protein